MIEVVDFHKCYGQQVAASGVSFDVQPGQVLGLIGPNGAGKTTTMRAIAGINPPSKGTLRVAEFDVQKQPLETKRRLAYIPDDPQLFTELTVAEHLAFVASAYNVSDAEERIDSLLTQFDLRNKVNDRVGDLSRGMRQKLAICCGYIHDPQAILFDEPLTGLDPKGIRVLKASIHQRAQQGSAVVISSHLLAMVEDTVSHVLILDKGQQKFFGPVEEVKANFANGGVAVSLEEVFFQATAEVAAV